MADSAHVAEIRLLEDGLEATWSDASEVAMAKPRRWRAPAAALLGVSLAAVAVVSLRARQVLSDAGAATSLAEVSCSAPGQNCLPSQCCMDGGDKGFQCFTKNENWGECMAPGSCTPGVHKGETHGYYNASGAFVLDQWSCKKVGNTSKPACSSYKEDKCPSDRCTWADDKCRVLCSVLPAGEACWKQDHCMVDGDQCKAACWLADDEDKCGALDRCMYQNSTCKQACHIHTTADSCPGNDQCMWQVNKCMKDPCSAPWEDCTKTQCCSGARGGLGMTCFKKNENYATCLNLVEKDGAQKGWDGAKLGNRTRFDAGCTWAGDECSKTGLCCNEGYNCAKKDDTFSGCQQALAVSTFFKKPVALPAGWDGTVLGGWRSEYQVAPAPEGKVSGMTFYCIMAVLPNSTETELEQAARDNNASVFGCDAHSIFNSWQTSAAGWDTGETTLINTAVFLKVFQWVKEAGLYLKYDWTIKVDADCVFLPERLRSHMWALKPPADTAIYLKNNGVEGLGNSGFLGAIEVFSRRAMQIYLDNSEGCAKFLGTNSGEDGFFKGCMDSLGVGYMKDVDIFFPDHGAGACRQGQRVAFHPLKTVDKWQHCVDIISGKKQW
mmetsp:Transcript_83730/g.215587  ORF Transcript_83730/g.215587 Transcript_83730/m.215587 type:complete len:608 (-) Transcript_83730:306-2129(-)